MPLLAAALFLSLSSPVWGTNCDTDLKPTDTYKELSAKLKCLNDRINAWEGSGGSDFRKLPSGQSRSSERRIQGSLAASRLRWKTAQNHNLQSAAACLP